LSQIREKLSSESARGKSLMRNSCDDFEESTWLVSEYLFFQLLSWQAGALLAVFLLYFQRWPAFFRHWPPLIFKTFCVLRISRFGGRSSSL